MKHGKILLVVILSLATVLRFYGLDYVPGLDYDSTLYMMKARDILQLTDTPLVGMQIYFGPFFFYLIASLGSIFGVSIFLARSILAIVGVMTVAMAYLVGKKYFNERVGIISAVLIALSPWQITHSRLIWEVNFVPLFVLIVLFMLVKSLKKKWIIPVIGFFLGMAFQSHPTSIVVLPVVVAFYFIKKREILFSKMFLLMFVLFILAYFPVLIFNAKNNFTTFNYFTQSFSSTSNQTLNISNRFNFVLQLIKENLSGLWRFTNIGSEPLFLDNAFHSPIVFILWIFSLVLLIYTPDKNKIFLLFANIFFLAILPFVSASKGLYTHYLMFFMPFLFLSISFLLSDLLSKKRLKYVVALFLLFILAQNFLYLSNNYFKFYYDGGISRFETFRCCKEEVADLIKQKTDNSTTVYFENDVNLFLPVSFYMNDYSYVILKECSQESFRKFEKGVYVFDYNSVCDLNFKAVAHTASNQEIIKSPSGKTNVFSIYFV
jgi:4-amino-4-deoxy-L-arabinose transferase-like glycosyltransferase